MDELFFVGTVHEHITPPEELIAVIRNLQPEKILVEIVQEDIDAKNISKYPPEMNATYHWAVENNISVAGFDSKISEEKLEVNQEELLRDLEIVKKQFKKIGWKNANKEKHIIEGREFLDKYCDLEKSRERQEEMAHNIEKSCNGKTVVVTGAGHLNFFSKRFPQANFPLR